MSTTITVESIKFSTEIEGNAGEQFSTATVVFTIDSGPFFFDVEIPVTVPEHPAPKPSLDDVVALARMQLADEVQTLLDAARKESPIVVYNHPGKDEDE